jgi:hypothetical protein
VSQVSPVSQVSQEDVERLAESLRILGGQALEWHEESNAMHVTTGIDMRCRCNDIAEMKEVIAALAARVAAIETRLGQEPAAAGATQDDFDRQIHAWWGHDQWQRERQ